MSIIIETCPKCGHDLQDLVIATYPPIPAKRCFNCGWTWEGKREEVVRVPFKENFLKAGYSEEDSCTLANLATDSTISYNGLMDVTEAINSISNAFNNVFSNFAHPACINCSSHPKNGGSGICNCTLGQVQIT